MPRATYAGYAHTPDVSLFKGNDWQTTFSAYDLRFSGGVQVAVGDFDEDGISEIVTAPGAGGAPHIRIMRQDGSSIEDFFAYDVNMRAGVNVAVGDLNGDGSLEIVTAPQSGGAPQVRIFSKSGTPIFTPGFFAYDTQFRGGVNLAVGDLDGDGKDEIITGAGAGGAAHVRVFDQYGIPEDNLFPFHPDYRGGIVVGAANVDGGPEDELLVGVQGGDSAWVKVLKRNGINTQLSTYKTFPDNFHGGIRMAGADMNGDGFDEVIVAAGKGGGPQVLGYSGHGTLTGLNFFSYGKDFRGGVNIATGDLDGDGKDEVVTGPSTWRAESALSHARYVQVDLSDQRLEAFENGRMVKSFLVSTGLPKTPTRPGTFQISEKIYSHLYSGPDYYLPNTLYNLRFDGPRLLHGAYWHNNFGKPMSHGCVNIAYKDAVWLYDWMQIGDTVIIKQ
ncbi:MAG: L,D-transpeptidase family protein [Candidatus Kerfeldbacteria bacterium]|nr:L,D-transpeptidase family protein [Candidatus Kerfeldbacteria bacterium]